jgi:hypothetical protein
MLAPILDAKRPLCRAAYHLARSGRQRKARRGCIHPDTGEVLPAKKVRGSKAGGYIDLGGGCAPPARMIAARASKPWRPCYTRSSAPAGICRARCSRVGIDLGNLAGRATKRCRIRTLKTAGGRPQRVPGLDPDRVAPAMPVPLGISELILLGDGDSDPFLTSHRWNAPGAAPRAAGPHVRIRFAPAARISTIMIKRGGMTRSDEVIRRPCRRA